MWQVYSPEDKTLFPWLQDRKNKTIQVICLYRLF